MLNPNAAKDITHTGGGNRGQSPKNWRDLGADLLIGLQEHPAPVMGVFSPLAGKTKALTRMVDGRGTVLGEP